MDQAATKGLGPDPTAYCCFFVYVVLVRTPSDRAITVLNRILRHADPHREAIPIIISISPL